MVFSAAGNTRNQVGSRGGEVVRRDNLPRLLGQPGGQLQRVHVLEQVALKGGGGGGGGILEREVLAEDAL
jgi:hypothetical protein